MKNTKKAFTLIELLVVISIIALLLSILMPSLAKVKESGKKAICLSNIRNIGLANTLYAASNDDRYVAWYDETIYDYVRNWPFVEWCTNPTFLEILAMRGEAVGMLDFDGIDAYVFPKAFQCPSAAKTTQFKDYTSESYCETTYAGNYTDSYENQYVKTSRVKQPAEKIMFLDSPDICMVMAKADYIDYWDIYGEVYDLDSGRYLEPAYRHSEGANGNYADGHVEYRKKEKLFYYVDDDLVTAKPDRERNERMWIIEQ